jgi:ribosomal protein L9
MPAGSIIAAAGRVRPARRAWERFVAEQLEETIGRHDVRLEDPIRRLGTHQVEVHLHEEVNALVTVEVISHEEVLE